MGTIKFFNFHLVWVPVRYLALVLALSLIHCNPNASAAGPEALAYRGQASASLGDLRGRLRSGSTSLERVDIDVEPGGDVLLRDFPTFNSEYSGHFAGLATGNKVVLYSVNPELQRFVSEMVAKAESPHVAVVAIEPKTGRILAIADKSAYIPRLAYHSGFPAASLFKVVTSAAALERTNLDPDSLVRFRGGPYTLERWNYLPNAKRDRRSMTFAEALGKSCNAAFGRIGNILNADLLRQYARSFGFNTSIQFENSLPVSQASIPEDGFELSRTAAGFGEVNISPVHAAMLMAGIANGGTLLRPTLVDRVVTPNGATIYQSKVSVLQRMMKPATADELMNMMVSTTTIGTSKKEFMSRGRRVLGSIQVSAKTGTLSGQNPKGLNHWFIAAAPKENPQIALSVIVVDPRSSKARAARLGRLVIEKFLN